MGHRPPLLYTIGITILIMELALPKVSSSVLPLLAVLFIAPLLILFTMSPHRNRPGSSRLRAPRHALVVNYGRLHSHH